MNRNRMTKIMVAAAAMLISFTTTGLAQCQEKLVVDVPFAFRANGVDMPAGAYATDPNIATQTVQIRALAGKPGIFVRCDGARTVAADRGEYGLIFTKIGSTYLLSGIWEGNQESRVHLPKADTKLLLEASNASRTFILARR